jgi:hypothetical protein
MLRLVKLVLGRTCWLLFRSRGNAPCFSALLVFVAMLLLLFLLLLLLLLQLRHEVHHHCFVVFWMGRLLWVLMGRRRSDH